MEHFITLILSNYGDSMAIMVCIAFLYQKVGFLTGKVNDVQKELKKHIDYHLCQQQEKGE